MLLDIKHYIKKTEPLQGWRRGIVVDNNDPKRLGRVRCIIKGLFIDDAEKLPWVYQKSPSMLGGASDSSFFAVPELGSELIIEFPFEDIYFPVYTGYWQNEETHQDVFDQNYPHSYGFTDKSGFRFLIDKAAQVLEIKHPSGAGIFIDKEGKVDIRSSGPQPTTSGDKKNNVEISPEEREVNVRAENYKITANEITIKTGRQEDEYGSKETTIRGSDKHSVLGNAKDITGGSKNEIVGVNKSEIIAQDYSKMVGSLTKEVYSLGRVIDIASGGETKTVALGNIIYSTPAGTILMGSAVQPSLRGADTAEWMISHTHPTGTGPSGPPVEAAKVIQLLSKKFFSE